jgi:hypothetical protein
VPTKAWRGHPDRYVRRHAVQPGDIGDEQRPHVEVIAGMNLPMLIKLAGVRGETTWTRRSSKRPKPAGNTSMSQAASSAANNEMSVMTSSPATF